MAVTKTVQTANAVRRMASYEYSQRIPVATQTNIAQIAQTITDYQPFANEFINALINRIVRTIITSRMWDNPLAVYKKGAEAFGDTVEEIFTNIANAHMYDPSVAEDEVFRREMPDIAAAFHRRNSQVFYKVTIQNESLRAAFVSDDAMQSFIGGIVDTLYKGANYDEFLTMKSLLGANKDYYYPITVPEVNADNSNAIVAAIRAASNMMPFGGGKYNKYGLFNATEKARQVLIIRADAEAIIDVNSLAAAFNLEYREFVGRRIVVDSFPAGMEDVIALLTDDNFFMVFNNLDKFTEIYNAQGLYWNYFYHVWRTYSVSPFSNVIAFTTKTVDTPNDVTVNGDASAKPGETHTYTATVGSDTSEGVKPAGVTWSISGQKRGGTYISPQGILTIDPLETASEITVKATSTYSETVSGTKAVTVSGD